MNKHLKPAILVALFMVGVANQIQAQSDPTRDYKNYPIIVTLQFHAFALPFKDFKSNFKNMGIGLGTETSHNGEDNWVQQFNILWYKNKSLGNGIHINTQTVWRPTLVDEVYSEVKLGIGCLYSFRPNTGYRQVDSNWISTAHGGKMMLAIPAGIGIGYHNYSTDTQVSPFAGYQFMLVNGYNKSIPLVPETLVQFGARVHTK